MMTGGAGARSLRTVNRWRRATAIDLGICAVTLAYAIPPTTDPTVNDPAATVFGPLALPALLVPVLLRRRAPLAAAVAFAAGCVVSGLPTFDQFRLIVAVPAALLVVSSLATRCSLLRSVAGFVIVLAGLTFVGATEAVLDGAAGTADMVAFSFPLCFVTWGAGRIVWSRERIAEQLTERSEQLRRQREATAALAVEIDRARLASDLDLAARSRLREMIELASVDGCDPASGRARFSRIEALGRESLDQMRALLGVLRNSDRGSRAPRPTLEQLDGLLAGARAGGRVVNLEIDGEYRPLGAGVELAAYRTVQHALAAVGCVRDQPATVRLRYLPDQLELEVRGLRAEGSAARAALLAARERVTALGGNFSAETTSPGHRVLRVRLPTMPANA
jgi:signal transduction histidine kinase